MAPNDRRQWVAIELDFADNPKVLSVGALGGWAHLRAIIYAARHRTDGFLPQAAAEEIARASDEASGLANGKQTPSTLSSMTLANLWHPVANGYQIHDYLEHQSNAESIREKRRRAGRLGGLAKAKQASKQAGTSKLEVELDLEVEDKSSSALGVAVDVATALNGKARQEVETEEAEQDLVNPNAVASLLTTTTAGMKDIPF